MVTILAAGLGGPEWFIILLIIGAIIYFLTSSDLGIYKNHNNYETYGSPGQYLERTCRMLNGACESVQVGAKNNGRLLLKVVLLGETHSIDFIYFPNHIQLTFGGGSMFDKQVPENMDYNANAIFTRVAKFVAEIQTIDELKQRGIDIDLPDDFLNKK